MVCLDQQKNHSFCVSIMLFNTLKLLIEQFLTCLQRISNMEFDFTDHISIHLCAMSWGYVMSQGYVNGIVRSSVQGFCTWTNVMALYSEVFVDSVFACCSRSHCKDLPTKSIFMLMLLGVFVEPHYDMIICSKRTLLAGCMGPPWGPSGAGRTQVGPMLTPWTLLYGHLQKPLHSSPMILRYGVSFVS